jgi:hypothetical protein
MSAVFDVTDGTTWDDANLPAGWAWRDVGTGEWLLYNADGNNVSRFYAGPSPSDLGGFYIGDIETGASLGNWPTKEGMARDYDAVIAAFLARQS